MTKNPYLTKSVVAAIAAALVIANAASVASASSPAVTEQIEPAEIQLGGAAELTISVSGSNAPIAPPATPGLEFVAVGQSSQIETVNGQTSSTTSVTYQVIPQRTGVFTIAAATPASEPLVLHVLPGSAGGSALPGSAGPSSLATMPGNGPTADSMRQSQGGLTFVRLQWPKRQPYVGESIPVEIQVGVRAGIVASVDGLPTLNGDAFTLGKLSAKPDQTELTLHGEPYTVLTWRSVLVPVKSGAQSLAIEAPLTVQVPEQPVAAPEPSSDESLDAIFNDPFFQNAMRTTVERHVDATSAPTKLDVRELPLANRPPDFSGAVGSFRITSDLSTAATTAGDPLTLNLHVTGNGNFDRVDSTMLGAVDGWKTYPPTATFTPADSAGDRGEKTFSQPVVATQSGARSLPALTFSFFNPETGSYESLRTSPQAVAVAADPAGSVGASLASTGGSTPNGLRPDQVETGTSVSSLLPFYFQPRMLAIPSILMLAMGGAWFGLLRREQVAGDVEGSRQRKAAMARQALLAQMEAASALGNATAFFHAARSALQEMLAQRWNVPPQSITTADVDARLADNADVRSVFACADEASYSGRGSGLTDFNRWKTIVRRQLDNGIST